MRGGILIEFAEAYESWLRTHSEARTGERRRRLTEGHGHGEKLFAEHVWWPAFGNFQHLHPEYEVRDYRDGYRYIDFAYIRSPLRLAIEVDGYGPHLRQVSRRDFSDHLHRQNQLVIDGWSVLRFSFDDLAERPRWCQQTIQQFMGRRLGKEQSTNAATCIEKEIVRLGLRLIRPLTPKDVCRHLNIESKYARKLLHELVKKQWLKPHSGTRRIRAYKIDMERLSWDI